MFGSSIESTKYGPRVTSVADSQAAVPLEFDPVPEPEPVELELPVDVPPAQPARNCASAVIVPLAKTAPPTRITSRLEKLFILSILRLGAEAATYAEKGRIPPRSRCELQLIAVFTGLAPGLTATTSSPEVNEDRCEVFW